MQESIVHVLPVGDTQLHEESGTYCNCNPSVERLDGGTVVVHNSFDGREFAEGSEICGGRMS